MIAEQYRLAWNFMKRRVEKPFFICIAAFVLLTLIVAAAVRTMTADTLVAFYVTGNLGGLLGDEVNTWYGFFFHNGGADLAGIVLGLVPFLPVTAAIMALNAAMWGLMAGFGAVLAKTSLLRVILLCMLPHCIFEVPANCISDAMGILLFIAVTKKVRKKACEPLLPLLADCLRVFLLFVLPLLLAAGITEAYLTPMLSGMI